MTFSNVIYAVIYLFKLRFKQLWMAKQNCSKIFYFEKGTILRIWQLLCIMLHKSCGQGYL